MIPVKLLYPKTKLLNFTKQPKALGKIPIKRTSIHAKTLRNHYNHELPRKLVSYILK